MRHPYFRSLGSMVHKLPDGKSYIRWLLHEARTLPASLKIKPTSRVLCVCRLIIYFHIYRCSGFDFHLSGDSANEGSRLSAIQSREPCENTTSIDAVVMSRPTHPASPTRDRQPGLETCIDITTT